MQQTNEPNKQGQKPTPDSPSKRKAKSQEKQNTAPQQNAIAQPKFYKLNLGDSSLQVSAALYENKEFIAVFNHLVEKQKIESFKSFQNFKSLESLGTELTTAKYHLNKTSAEKSELAEQLRLSEERCSQLEEENHTLKMTNFDFAGQKKLLQDENTKLKNRTSKAECEIKNSKKQHDALLSQQEKDQVLINHLQAEKAELEKELQETRNKLAYETNQKLSQPAHDPEKEKLIKEVSILQKEKESLEQEYTQNITELQVSADSKLRAKLSQVQTLQKQLEMANASAKNLAMQSETAKKLLVASQEQNKQLKTQIDQHIAYSMQSKEALEKISMEKQELMNENSNLSREKEALEKQQKAFEEKITTKFENLHSELLIVKSQKELIEYHLQLAKDELNALEKSNKKRKVATGDVTPKLQGKPKKIKYNKEDMSETDSDTNDKVNKKKAPKNRYSVFNESQNQQHFAAPTKTK